MPRVHVILKNAAPVTIENANEAEWLLANGNPTPVPAQGVTFIVYFKESNTTKILGRFLAHEVIGFTLDETP